MALMGAIFGGSGEPQVPIPFGSGGEGMCDAPVNLKDMFFSAN